MADLHLTLLGAPLVTLQGRPVTFATAKMRALLVYLAVERNRAHPRETLMTLLWQDSDDAAARASLRQALAGVRETLADSSRTEPFLLVTRDSVQVNPAAAIDVDVLAFRQNILKAAQPAQRPSVRLPAVAAAREQALHLYQGEFLAGAVPADSAPFAEWAVVWRERLHQQALEAAIGLAQHRELLGDLDGALRMWRRALALEPWHENAHLAVMRLLATLGERAGALAHYAAAEQVLSAELGIEPNKDLRALRAALEREDTTAVRAPAPVRRPVVGADLLGRMAELEQLSAWLADPTRRVITLHGPGGVGKTCLALAAARHNAVMFTEGAVAVPLASVAGPELVADAVLRALGIEPSSEAPLEHQVCSALAPQSVLLLLDNAEPLLPALAALIAGWIQAAPGLTVLVTSRQRLGLQAEWVLSVGGLSYAAAGPSQPDDAAAALFVTRVRRYQPDYDMRFEAEALGRLCRTVEGLPLALELAAALRVDRSVTVMVEALETQQLDLAVGWPDAPERHRSLVALFEYSWQALDVPARHALACWSVFRGTFDLDAASVVVDADAHQADHALRLLIDRALVREPAPGRFDLHDLVRAFALHKLSAEGLTATVQGRQLTFFLARTREAMQAGPLERAERTAALRPDLDNIRAALTFALAVPEALAAGELATAYSVLFWRLGLLLEAQTWLAQAIGLLSGLPPSVDRDRGLAEALLEIGSNASLLSNLQEAETHLVPALELARQQPDRVLLARVLATLARLRADQSRFDQAETLMLEGLALYETAGNALGVARSYMTLGEIAALHQTRDTAGRYYQEAIERFKTLNAEADLAIVLGNFGMLLKEEEQFEEAQSRLEASLELAERLDDRYVVASVSGPLAGLHLQLARQARASATREHHLERARAAAIKSIRETHAQGISLYRASGILQLAEIESVAGHPDLAARLLGAAEMARGLSDSDWEPTHRALVGLLQAELQPAFEQAYHAGRALTLEQVLADLDSGH
jgi:DNA-binding SARP family transcriptional activator